LKDKSDSGTPEESPIAFRQGSQVLTIYPNFAAVRRIDTTDQVKQGTLAAPALPKDGGDLTGLELGMSILQDDAPHIAFIVGFRQIMETEKWGHGYDCIVYMLKEHQFETVNVR
jgi:hypothetical protein